MLCDRCQTREATVFTTSTAADDIVQKHSLCAACAREKMPWDPAAEQTRWCLQLEKARQAYQ